MHHILFYLYSNLIFYVFFYKKTNIKIVLLNLLYIFVLIIVLIVMIFCVFN